MRILDMKDGTNANDNKFEKQTIALTCAICRTRREKRRTAALLGLISLESRTE